MRLIDANAVVEQINRKANSGQWSEGVVYGMAKAMYLVKTAPTIERPHGEWIFHTEWYSDGECAFECSRCGMGSDVDYNFCPNCGSDNRKMGEAE